MASYRNGAIWKIHIRIDPPTATPARMTKQDDGEVLAPLRGQRSLGSRTVFLDGPRRVRRFRRSRDLSKVQRIGSPRSVCHAVPYDVRRNRPRGGIGCS